SSMRSSPVSEASPGIDLLIALMIRARCSCKNEEEGRCLVRAQRRPTTRDFRRHLDRVQRRPGHQVQTDPRTASGLRVPAHAAEPVHGRIHIEKINEPFLFRDGGSPAEYGAGLKLAIDRGWLSLHESGTFVTFTPAGAELFA